MLQRHIHWRVRTLSFLALLSLPCLLSAQQASAGKPQWFNPEALPKPPPELTKPLELEYPPDLLGTQTHGYALVGLAYNKESKRYSRCLLYGSNFHFAESVADLSLFAPALKNPPGENEFFWIPIVFNPKEADSRAPNRLPSLLKVAPLLSDTKGPDEIWLTLQLDEQGKLSGYTFDSPSQESFKAEIDACLANWAFLPAHKEGKGVPGSLHLPIRRLSRQEKLIFTNTKVIPPKAIKRARPEYPFELQRFGMEGTVVVAFTINKEGKVELPYVQTSTHPGFNKAAIEAVRTWVFTPATRDGSPIKFHTQAPIFFQIAGGGKGEYMRLLPLSKEARNSLPEELRYDTPPECRDVQLPIYPYTKLRAKEGGSAEVAVIIGPNGSVLDLKVLSATAPEFGASLAASLRSLRFAPAIKNGKPSKCLLRMKQVFSPSGQSTSQQLTPSLDDLEMLRLEETHPEKILSSADLDKPLRPVSLKAPRLPEELYEMTGSVIVELIVNEEGRPCLPHVISATHPELGELALISTSGWTFEPPTLKRKPVNVRIRVPVKFDPPEKS